MEINWVHSSSFSDVIVIFYHGYCYYHCSVYLFDWVSTLIRMTSRYYLCHLGSSFLNDLWYLQRCSCRVPSYLVVIYMTTSRCHYPRAGPSCLLSSIFPCFQSHDYTFQWDSSRLLFRDRWYGQGHLRVHLNQHLDFLLSFWLTWFL